MWHVFAVLVLQFSRASTLHMSGLRHEKQNFSEYTSLNKDLLAQIVDAYHSRGGLKVSVTKKLKEPTGADDSGSVLRDDVPWFVIPFESTDGRGVIYDPVSPPAIACAYPSDASSCHREPNQCGLYAGDPVSGRCTMSPSEYVEYDDRFTRFRSCHFDTTEESLDAAAAYWSNRTAPDNNLGIHISAYNEIVLKEKQESIVALFWGHEGPFRMPTNDDIHACLLKLDYCSSTENSTSRALFEFAELWDMEQFSGSMCEFDAHGFVSCSHAPRFFRNGEATELIRKSATNIIREMDPKTICALDCTHTTIPNLQAQRRFC